VQSLDDAALNKQNDQVTLFPMQFDHAFFYTLPVHFWAWISLLLKIREYG